MLTALIILDGWGLNPNTGHNAIALANTPTMDRISQRFPYTTLRTSGRNVGLPNGLMGNSEAGHLSLGAGRVVSQAMTYIGDRIEDSSFLTNKALVSAADRVIAGGNRQLPLPIPMPATGIPAGRKLHLMGLVSDGGVHSWPTHYQGLLRVAAAQGVSSDRVFIHAFLDGRDTPPTSGIKRVRDLVSFTEEVGVGRVASICGRFYAMDRDRRWDRTKRAYDLLTQGTGTPERDPIQAIQHAYDAGTTDEFVEPITIIDDGHRPATVEDGDSIIFFNFRGDRPRQLTRAFTLDDFDGFERVKRPACHFTTLTRHEEDVPVDGVAYPPSVLSQDMPMIFGETVSAVGKRQLRIAETEKYAHVTFFFNGQRESPFDGESRILVPSPQNVATYDHKPEMSAPIVADKLITEIESGEYDMAICNFANADMVGHTGDLDAAVEAVATVDACLGRVLSEIERVDGKAIVTADHGNAEQMIHYDTGEPHTAHTTNEVPLVLFHPDFSGSLQSGSLCDVAPTLLGMMGIDQPDPMTGRDLRTR